MIKGDNMKKDKHLYSLSTEGKRIFENKIKETNGSLEMNGIEIYIDEEQNTPIKLRDKQVFFNKLSQREDD